MDLSMTRLQLYIGNQIGSSLVVDRIINSVGKSVVVVSEFQPLGEIIDRYIRPS